MLETDAHGYFSQALAVAPGDLIRFSWSEPLHGAAVDGFSGVAAVRGAARLHAASARVP